MAYLDQFLRVKPERRSVHASQFHWSETKQPPQPPPESYTRYLTGQRRKNAIAKAVEILKTYTFSVFQHEAAVRHGFRAALCKLGRKWSWADFEANEIVQAALNQLGAERPSWYAGQPEYVLPDENCKNVLCGRALDDEDIAEGSRYCSDWCKNSTMLYRYNTHRYLERLTEIRAYYHVAKQAAEPRTCALPGCGKTFRSLHDNVYCSRQCAADARPNSYELNICQNPSCGREFVHKNVGRRRGRFCSTACYYEGRCADMPEQECAEASCSNLFKPNKPGQKFCCKACTKRDHERRTRGRESLIDRPCEFCGERFSPTKRTSRFCSERHRRAAESRRRAAEKQASSFIIRCDPA